MQKRRDNIMQRKSQVSDSACHAEGFSDRMEVRGQSMWRAGVGPDLMACAAMNSEVNQPINPPADVLGQGLARSLATG